MDKFRIPVFVLITVFIFFPVPHVDAQTPARPPAEEPETAPQGYQESALRRFEIITLSSVPFTAIHSYLAVRGIKMYRVNKFAPELTPQNYRIIGIGAVSLSIFIGVWDWWRTRAVDRGAPRIRKPEPPPPPEQDEPIESDIAHLLENHSPYGIATSTGTGFKPLEHALNRWGSESQLGLTVQFVQIQF